MVTEEDIVTVATSIFMDIDGDTIEWVMQNFHNYTSDESYSNDTDIIERMLYHISEWRG
jgi:hypothetical protein